MPDHDRARRRRRGREARRPAASADAVGREPADLLADVRRRGGDGVVVVRLDPHHARGLRCAEPDREDRAERDRHLAEDVARLALADDALDPVDDWTASMRPASTAKSARSLPSGAAYSPGTRLMSAAARESRSSSSAPSAAKIVTPAISSGVTMTRQRYSLVQCAERLTRRGRPRTARRQARGP